MGLLKKVILKNGITLKYHRISCIMNRTNVESLIEITSYLDQTKRNDEIKYNDIQTKNNTEIELADIEKSVLNNGLDLYTNVQCIQLGYDETLDVKKAYNYLKTLDDFKNAEDI